MASLSRQVRPLISQRFDEVPDYRFNSRSEQRVLGAYYTSEPVTQMMAGWSLRNPSDIVLEPSFGAGAFLEAIESVAQHKNLCKVTLHAVELDRDVAINVAKKTNSKCARNIIIDDFTSVKPFPVDAVIGNPPYIRLRHLPSEQLKSACETAKFVMGSPTDPSGSLWLPFLLHSLRFIRPGGRLAMVLPHEITHVRYARSMWTKLGEQFADISVVRVRERIFPDILQDVVLLFCDGFGGHTDFVNFFPLYSVSDLKDIEKTQSRQILISSIASGNKSFTHALMSEAQQHLLAHMTGVRSDSIEKLCRVRIGYVAGDKDFFHPTDGVAKRYDLNAKNLQPSLRSGRQLASGGLFTSSIQNPDMLFLPKTMGDGENRYVAAGERQGVHERYKCRVRKPWYVVPGVNRADLLLSVFSERPILSINDAGLFSSNSLLCLYLKSKISAPTFAARWYTSLTLLQTELEVHALGGGVMILVPNEVNRIRLPRLVKPRKSELDQIHSHINAGEVEAAYLLGDIALRRTFPELTSNDVARLHDAVGLLRLWRTSSRAQSGRHDHVTD